MAAASYDQLLKQVEALKMENSNLRQELEDNSNHLNKLETEASNMKEVLKHIQGSIEEDSTDSSGQIDLLERLKEISLDPNTYPGVKLRSQPSSMQGSGSGRSGDSSPSPMGSLGSLPKRGLSNGGRDSAGYLEELEKEKSLLMAELEKEEKKKDQYYAQLQNLTKRIDSLPLTENQFSLQTDMTRRQLEYEARQIRAAMEKQLGTCQDMEKRAQVRVTRIQQIEKDILKIQQHAQSPPSEPESKHDPAAQDEGGQASGDSGGPSAGCSQGSSSRLDQDSASEMSLGVGSYSVPRRLTSHLGTKVEMVYSLLSMLGTHDKDDMSRTLLAMSSSQDSCIAMRQSGCLPLLIQLLHGNDKDSVLLGNSRGSKEARARASAALHNIIHSQPDDKRGRREIRVLHLLEQIRVYCETCWEWQETHERGVDQDKNPMPSPVEHQICPAVCVLMKLSFDEEHRHAMNELGGLQAIGELLQVDCEIYGLTSDHYSVTLRRYAGMALTNLTFGDVANKATLCSMKGCMRAMVAQLKSESEDLQQVIASVLRNLSWRADVNSKKTLREVGSVRALMECALEVQKESTLKSVLSALWNLSAHCTENKADICAVEGALAFLVSTLMYRSQTNTLAIIESGGGILRNVSSLIATNEDHRQILRENSCLQTLLQHLKSHSLTIVSNACGTLWNLSARNAKDQEALWEMGAVSMLKNLIHSKHKMIAMGSAAALRNLMANRPAKYKDANIMSPGSSLPSLHVRKQKALIEELDSQHLSETFDNIDNLSPKASHRDGFSPNSVPVRSPYVNTPVLSSPSPRDNPRGNIDTAQIAMVMEELEYKASNDSLNSVNSTDGYGKRGQMKPSVDSYSEDDEGKCCVYRKYPADLAHKIHNANHMEDDDGEVDTPINYSLKYSDEQLNSGRQSPSQNERWARPKHMEEMKQTDQRSVRSQSPGYPMYTEGNKQQDDQPTNYSMKYNKGPHTEQPIDYSLKYSDTSSQKSMFSHSKSSSTQSSLHPSSAQTRSGPTRPGQKNTTCKPPTVNQETLQTYCVEDTPICFSRGSSLSSLSSDEDEMEGCKRNVNAASNYPTLPISEKESTGSHAQEQGTTEGQSQVHGDGSRHHKAVEFSSGAKSPSKSGAQTPKSPPEHYVQETPLMFSRCTSVSSLDSFESNSIASSIQSELCSGMPSGIISPSDLPDSPGQTMPPSRSKTPPPPQHPPPMKHKKVLPDNDTLLHFATESTPDGFSCASSLSALSLDEPYIQKDNELKIIQEKHSPAMPTKSSRKPKKQSPSNTTSRIPPPTAHKPSQLPVYKLLPSQSRGQQKTVGFTHGEDMPRIYCIEGTPINFSTATSLSDLTIDSPPNELANAESCAPPCAEVFSSQIRDTIPEGEKNEGDDILAECISSAMPKGKIHKPFRVQKMNDQLQHPSSASPVSLVKQEVEKKKPTSPVKPMPQSSENFPDKPTNADERPRPGFAFDSPQNYTPIEGTPYCFSRNDSLMSMKNRGEPSARTNRANVPLTAPTTPLQPKQAVFPQPSKENVLPVPDEKQKFSIEDTPMCFSRNSSLSSLSDIDQENNNKDLQPKEVEDVTQVEATSKPQASGYAPKAFHVEDTPVCFSRNSSLSSLSIDSEDDLLQECISSAMPKKKKQAARNKGGNDQGDATEEKSMDRILAEEPDITLDLTDTRSPVSEQALSPDSESFDWKAIQEGANSIVSSLHQAAASLSRQGSSDSDSILSLKSGISLGSPFHLPLNSEDNKSASDKGRPRILKPGEKSTLEAQKKEKEEEAAKALKGGKKVYKSLITGKPRASAETPASLQQRPTAPNSTPSRPAQQSLTTRPMQSPGRTSVSPGRNGLGPSNKLSQVPRTASPSTLSTKSTSGIPRSESASKSLNQCGVAGPSKKQDLSRMSSTKSSGSESDRSEKPALVRQSTFIKEAPSPTLKRKLEESASFESLSPSSTSQSQTPPQRGGKHDISRSHSESPSRLPNLNRKGTWKRENSKHSSSLPRVGTWKRTGSSSSILSASSESTQRSPHGKDGNPLKGTWRKMKDKSMDTMAMGHQMSPAVSKTEDVWVRIEDCPINNPRSGKSPTANIPPTNLNLFRSSESIDKKGPDLKPAQSNPSIVPEAHELSLAERTPFSSSTSSKHSSPSGAVAARVSPFNYTPSSRKSSADSATLPRPSQIPTPVSVTNSAKKRETKGESAGESGSYIVTSV
ncbi:unnamed protein product [Oncorhynchus mykiss]|uniref:Adenomatous polyposis coli protein n=1 Tax=Oncorhynchus mykiss TaxID=8022 RepID=A0A060X4A3_ONCMY|nr:unnamed protein product [Oncorhynchus mykiss]